jgi:drug/metabolite transporter (DMT)-like permease
MLINNNIRAILICLCAYFCFDLMAVHVRFLSSRYNPQELSLYRNVLGVIPAILYLAYERQLTFRWADYRLKKWRLAVGRGLLIAIAQLMLYSSLMRLELATVSALGQTIAIFVVLLAIVIYAERIGLWRWGAVVTGLLGALMIVRPGSDVFTWYALFPIGAAFCYAASTVTLRSFEKGVSSAILFLYSSVASAFGALILAIGTTSFSPIYYFTDALIIISMSFFGGFGVVFLMYAFRNAPSSALAPFSYFSLINAFLLGWIFFGEFPINKLFPGIIFIVASGLVIIWRERNKSNSLPHRK